MATISRRRMIGTAAVLAGGIHAAPAGLKQDGRTAWYRDAKFGLFLHWGPYSLAGVEASWPIMVPNLIPRAPITEAEYRALPSRFNPVKYDPKSAAAGPIEWMDR